MSVCRIVVDADVISFDIVLFVAILDVVAATGDATAVVAAAVAIVVKDAVSVVV